MRKFDTHIQRICAEAGLGVMVQVYEIVCDREERTDEELLALTADDVESHYNQYVGPAIDRIETDLQAPVVDAAPLDDKPTWTFVGHWENDRIVVEYVLPGDQQDVREDVGHWEQGLFAAPGTGATQEEALLMVRIEYETFTCKVCDMEVTGEPNGTGGVSWVHTHDTNARHDAEPRDI